MSNVQSRINLCYTSTTKLMSRNMKSDSNQSERTKLYYKYSNRDKIITIHTV